MSRKCALISFLLLILVVPLGVSLAQDATPEATSETPVLDLSGVKTFLLGKCTILKDGADQLQRDSNTFYNLAQAAKFDYTALWQNNQDQLGNLILTIQADWIAISPVYEKMEGIVAGVPALSKYDPIIDAGAKGETEYDVTLPDGTVLSKPGNLFGLLETTLWGTDPDYIIKMSVDFNGNGTQDFGEVMPNANLLKGFADSMVQETSGLFAAANQWEPTQTDVFTALVMNVPTLADFFNSWKTSRFVMGDKATHEDFVVISRLSDIVDNVGSWQVMWEGLSPAVSASDAMRESQVMSGLTYLHDYVSDLYTQEKGGRHFTPEEADLFSSEAQDRATAIVGQIAQVAAELNIQFPQ